MTRNYQMSRRAATAEETRQRIVRATWELHSEKGIGATSVRDIAERADVSPGTVYHHFPDYDDVIVACGKFTVATTRPPSRAIFEGLDSPSERLRRLVEETFAYYRRFPSYEKIRAERDDFVPLDHAFLEDEKNRRTLIREALKPRRVSRQAIAVAFALLDISVYHRLVRSGLSHSDTIGEIHRLIEQRLLET